MEKKFVRTLPNENKNENFRILRNDLKQKKFGSFRYNYGLSKFPSEVFRNK